MNSFERNNMFFQVSTEKISIPERDEVEEKYTWNLKDIYKSDGEWEDDFKWIEEKLNEYNNFRDKLHQSAEVLLSCLKFDDSIGIKLERLHLYAMLSKDSDLRVNKYQSMDDRIKTLYSKVGAASSFIHPEILNISEEDLQRMISSNIELKVYEHSLKNLLRLKNHTLSDSEEKILALASELTQTPYNTFSMFTNADLKFPFVEDESRNSVQLSHARFYSAMYSKNRDYREKTFKGYLGTYKEYTNTLAALLNGNLKTNIFNAKARNYSSALEAALDRNNISISVYNKLIESANNNISPLHRWASLKKKLLGINELKPFDVYVSLFDKKLEKKYSYDQAVEIVLDSLKIMGDDYLNSLKTAFENRWIDVYETKAKKSGAYSSGTTYGVHPYVLLNWTDLLNDVFTLSHEMGHNMHSFYTGQTQLYPYANYSIFLAEVASTFNEALLLDYLIDKSSEKEEKLFLMEKYMNNITATFYRQVMFAEFEKIIYVRTESGEALTSEVLCALFSKIYKKYWGPDMNVEEEESYTWSRIPHFYYNFYVYQYATGFAASEELVKKVKKEGQTEVAKYLNFLKAGSSDYPLNILATAGVDMNSEKPVLAVSEKMDAILDEMENLIY
ncbi:MAG: oligoendopeptidase F [Ignavibacteria bacterium]|nr:oligoendopeptidase F [Ignavibacteria bacterium]MBT8383739.1 oligoendopeptidase F [Ignavibacteria bacterium]MBT8392511.1 oligoendopeptidase F [Ignavibacteria bacterium]NNJ52080.1 oligoendopeptidase F [Ignavibacteriaceae bacterium]NNL19871.1 oligoendopeptidase F [Ignavibacteriaceae bacterium]